MDHIIPRAVVPELDHVIANLELMPLRLNERKNSHGAVCLVAGIALLVRNVLEFPAALTPGIVTMGLLLSALVGVAAGYWPARAASNLPVVDALRAE